MYSYSAESALGVFPHQVHLSAKPIQRRVHRRATAQHVPGVSARAQLPRLVRRVELKERAIHKRVHAPLRLLRSRQYRRGRGGSVYSARSAQACQSGSLRRRPISPGAHLCERAARLAASIALPLPLSCLPLPRGRRRHRVAAAVVAQDLRAGRFAPAFHRALFRTVMFCPFIKASSDWFTHTVLYSTECIICLLWCCIICCGKW